MAWSASQPPERPHSLASRINPFLAALRQQADGIVQGPPQRSVTIGGYLDADCVQISATVSGCYGAKAWLRAGYYAKDFTRSRGLAGRRYRCKSRKATFGIRNARALGNGLG